MVKELYKASSLSFSLALIDMPLATNFISLDWIPLLIGFT